MSSTEKTPGNIKATTIRSELNSESINNEKDCVVNSTDETNENINETIQIKPNSESINEEKDGIISGTDKTSENMKETKIQIEPNLEIINKENDGEISDVKKISKEINKVLLFLRPVGEASGLKKTRYKLDGSKSIIEVENFLKKTLGMPFNQNLFLYCGSGFNPTPDQNLKDLFDNFQTGGELIVNYGIQEVWG